MGFGARGMAIKRELTVLGASWTTVNGVIVPLVANGITGRLRIRAVALIVAGVRAGVVRILVPLLTQVLALIVA
ncbi:hypothetical protein QBC34DRAFT_396288 [Podospora aff. communis PSN243]|uniref:Uncharacterized protein n=1 Tax=Podospora aff. communis PSN243 TaxID=3040156 RepID=A0AAV9GYS7_9PEZI|nr:hypothetical protein QBC34DRAFT_396288 [Podospora aff. communis PSN243]